jgi:predicted phosphodiesterase
MPKNDANDLVKLSHSPAANHLKAELARQPPPGPTYQLQGFVEVLRNLPRFAYHYLKSRFGPRHPYQSYPHAGDSGVYAIEAGSGPVTFGLLSDWASDTAESDAVGALVAAHAPDYTIHLGDVYFVGTPREVRDNFTAPYASWPRGKAGSLALSGNHEMYSNGRAFFEELLPAMRVRQGGGWATQRAGFFCLENEHWRLIGLDTGYTSVGRPFVEMLVPPDCHFRDEQVAWLKNQVELGNPKDRRGLIFLSHHPYFSAFRRNFTRPAAQLRQLLGKAERPVVWLWGHEHRLTIYDHTRVDDGPEVWGRGIGHGGMPVELEEPKYAEKYLLRYYDRRIRTRLRNTPVGHNGFALLFLDGPTCRMQYRDDRDAVLLEETWTLNPETGELRHNEKTGEMLLARYEARPSGGLGG